MGLRSAWLVAMIILALSGGDVAYSITCDECRDLQKQRSDVQVELARKERELDQAVTRRDFRKISGLRGEVNQLRAQLLNMRGRDEECVIACRPDVMKELECRKLLEEIASLESGATKGADDTSKEPKGVAQESDAGKTAETKPVEQSDSAAKIDELYRDLARCHRELKRLQEIHHR